MKTHNKVISTVLLVASLFVLSGCSNSSVNIEQPLEINNQIELNPDTDVWSINEEASLSIGHPSYSNEQGCFLINRISPSYQILLSNTENKTDKEVVESVYSNMKFTYRNFNFKSDNLSQNVEMATIYTENYPFVLLGDNKGVQVVRLFSKYEDRILYSYSVDVEIRCDAKTEINESVLNSFSFSY
jgi:hypothetical protein